MKTILETLKKKWAEYLLEIIVIMIGIIGAYGLNNWNETRKNKLRTKSHLEELKAELLYDLSRLENVTIEFDIRDEAGLYVNEFLSGTLLHVDTMKLKYSYLIAGHLAHFGFTDVAYNNLINSGNIGDIENDSLKRMLGLLHSDDEWSKKYINEGMLDIYNAYHNYIVKHADPLIVRQSIQNTTEIFTVAKIATVQLPENLSIRWENVKKDSTYQMLLDQVVANRIIQRMNYLQWKRDISELVKIIEQELSK